MSKKQTTNTASDKRINSRLQETPIAIVGMASVFAESKNLGQFWDTIVNSVNGIQDVPEDRWAIDDYYSADKKEADKSYCKRGGFLPEIDFDPMEFGLPPNILELTDITQLMALVVARDVLADAGVSEESSFDRDRMGITLGVGGGQKQGGQLMSRLQGPVLEKVLKASGLNAEDTNIIVDKFKSAYIPWEENSFPGMLGNVIAGRIANRFNLGGTNCVVDAACAGSLAAIKMAVSDLLEYRSDMMLSGGICCDNSPFMYMSFSKTPAFTDGDCIRPFDDKSNGMMIGEGVGMIALKRLEDAERDGDRIYSVIKGIGSSSDGKFKSIYAPRPEGQLKALKRAYQDAGFDPRTCGLIEAHGTGTKAGDAAEFRGLELLFSENNDQKQHVALGSVKSQVGHTKAAAGTAGLIKAALALHHKVLPATINVDKPNENLDIENTPLYINSETRPWMPRADGIKRQAGISSFGFGGTNFHLVLEEYTSTQQGAYRLNEVAQSFLIAANSKADLINTIEAELKAINVDVELQPYAFNQLVVSHPVKKIKEDHVRCGFVAKNATQAKQMLEQIIKQLKTEQSKEWSTPTGIYYREQGLKTAGKVVALFSGQGSQYVNMGRELVCHFPSMMASQVSIDQQFHQAGQANLSNIVYPIPVFDDQKRSQQELDLRLTQYAQPAIGSFSVGLFNTFKQAGFKADFMAGHSFGELTALWAAEVISETDYMALAMARGQAMSSPQDSDLDAGTMAAVIGNVAEIELQISTIKDVSIANYNANNQAVIAGSSEAIATATTQLTDNGFKVIALPVSAAFHTPLVAHAQQPFAKAIDSVTFNKPKVAVYANATGEAHSEDQAAIKASLKEHILQSVQFSKEINSLYDAGGRIFVEFGPKNVLTRLVDNILEDKAEVYTIATNSNAKQSADLQLRQAAIQLAVLGVELDNIDPYSAIARPIVAPKKSPLAMKLSGASYVSPKTKKVFEDGLTDNWKISNTQPSTPIVKEVIKEVVVEKIVEKIVYVDAQGQPLVNQPSSIQGSSIKESAPANNDNQQLASSIENSVDQFVKHQSELLAVHQAYLEGPNQYADTFKSVLAAQAGQQTLPEGLDRTLAMYHDFQTETLRVHETYLNNQTDNIQQMLNTVSNTQHHQSSSSYVTSNNVTSNNVASNNTASNVSENAKTTPRVISKSTTQPAPVNALNLQQQLQATHQTIQSAQAKPSVDIQPVNKENNEVAPLSGLSVDSAQAIESTMLSVVADKTGYPTEMLELSMDMEADLGIDSIKRVEILGAVQDEIADLPELDAEQLSQMRTLAEIVTYMNSVMGSIVSSSVNATNATANTASTIASSTSSIDAQAIDINVIEKTMLSVVADKTGYPTEMLELSMDMEADLGIDSIKRVEILGAVQDEIADLPELDAEQLSQMRTLAEIVTYMNSVMGSIVSSSANTASTVANSATSIDTKAIENTMLSVVADKTGYPTEMLELSMDMEADLGIDSIKRVEILGAVQDEIADLPELDAEQLSQMRTLSEIVTYMNSVMGSIVSSSAGAVNHANAASTVASSTSSIDAQAIEKTMLSVVADKTGYPTEMLELSMDMEADLGIDSIKRVEILGAAQDEIAYLPELDAEQLSQMRTLSEIVTYMNSVMGSVVSNPVSPVVSSTSSIDAQAIDINVIEKTMLSVVADKTGYPTEMLELSMDMEADLGIDSIKRVEILGAVQDEITDLPELDAEQLSQMRTLDEIICYMQSVQTGPIVNAHSSLNVANEETPVKPTPEKSIVLDPSPSATVEIKKLAALECINSSVENKHLLLVNDGLDSGVATANELSALGWTVTVLTPSWVKSKITKAFNKSILQVSLSELTEQTLNQVLETQDQWLSVIYLHPKTAVEGIAFESQYKKGLQLAFLLAKLTKLNQNANEKNNGDRSSFLVLTRQGGDFATQNIDKKADLVQGGLSGLVKTLAHEWDNVFCRIVDIPTKYNANKVAKIVVGELNDKQRLPVEVGFNTEGRLSLVTKETDSYQLESGNQLDQDSVFLVSGGAKGVTAHCVIEIAKQYQCKFILLGRSRYQAQENDWSLSSVTEGDLKKAAMQHLINSGEKPSPKLIKQMIGPVLANREITQTLQAIETLGGIAEYVSADVCDKEKLQQTINPICDLWGPITGVIHGAGVLADKLIEQKTLAEFDQVYNTKIEGLNALLACCELEKLKHLVLFSSAAGFYGNPAQSDYAIANEILNKVAYRFKALYPTTQVLSFNWGPWDGGMVTPELKRMFDERGVYIIPVQSGASLLVSELAAKHNRCVQIVVGTDMSGTDSENLVDQRVVDQSIVDQNNDNAVRESSHQQIKTFNHLDNALLVDHKIDGQQVLPTVCAIAWLKSTCESLYPEYQYQGIEDFKLFKGIVFDGSQADEYVIDTKILEHKVLNSKTIKESDNTLRIEVTVGSENKQGKPVFHYKSTVNLAKPLVENSPLAYQGILPKLVKKQSAQAASLYVDGSLFHGPSLQGIKHIHQLDDSGLLLECVIDKSVTQAKGEFLLEETNVFANDLVYQAMLVWTSKQMGSGSLPTSTAAWQVFREVKVDEFFFIKLNIIKTTGQSVFADLLLIDQNNNIISKITAAEVTCSASLSELFKVSA